MKPERGEATVVLSVAGALATGAPVVLAVSGKQFGDGIIWVGAIVAALTAIGIGVGKVWTLFRAAGRKLDQIEGLVERAERMEGTQERMELRQLATQDQLRDLSARGCTPVAACYACLSPVVWPAVKPGV